VWERLREVRLGSPCSPLVRDRLREADHLRLLALFLGCTSSLGAMGHGNELRETLGSVTPDAERYLSRKGRSFRGITAHKRERRLAV
jgi:hypothetical protein